MKIRRKKPAQPLEPRLKAADIVGAPEVEVDIRFDPAVDLQPEQIRDMEKTLKERLRIPLDFLGLSRVAAAMKLLFPEKDFFDEELWKIMLTDLSKASREHAAELACNMAIFAPEKRAEIAIKEEEWNSLEQLLQSRRGNGQWWEIAGQAMHMLVARPEKKAVLQLDERAWNGMLAMLNDFRSRESWWQVSILTMRMSLLFPERRNQIPPITKEEWEKMREMMLAFEVEGLGYSVPLFAMSGVVNSAENATITPSGQLVITQKPPSLRKEEPLPDRRII